MEGGQGGGEDLGTMCKKCLSLYLFFFSCLPSHISTCFLVRVCHMFVLPYESTATFEQQTRFFNSVLSASAHHLLLGNLLATHTYVYTHTCKSKSLATW